MANLGREHIELLVNRGSAWKRRAEAIRERLTGVAGKAVRTLEVATAAGIGGVIQGKAGKEGSTIMHVPTDLGLGLVLNGLGYFNAAGKHSDHLNNLGDGFLACFTSSLGFGAGKAWGETGKFSLVSKPSGGSLAPGPDPTSASGEISAHQMADIVARVKAAAMHG